MTRILLVDDHHLIRKQLRRMIETRQRWEICGESENGQDAISKHSSLRPHIVIMDFNMPFLNGLESARQILKDCPGACILMLSISDTASIVQEAKKVGVKGFCSKNSMNDFFDAVEAILGGGTYFHDPQ